MEERVTAGRDSLARAVQIKCGGRDVGQGGWSGMWGVVWVAKGEIMMAGAISTPQIGFQSVYDTICHHRTTLCGCTSHNAPRDSLRRPSSASSGFGDCEEPDPSPRGRGWVWAVERP